MAAPEYVPAEFGDRPRVYTSPPRRRAPWRAERPGDFAGEERQPEGEHLGSQGPDQGYALKLARRFRDQLHLQPGESEEDAEAGAVLVALKRASRFGRAPIIHDLRVAFTIWGFLDANPPAELLELRRGLFAGAHHPHHYAHARHIPDHVDRELLGGTPEEITDRYPARWRELVSTGPGTATAAGPPTG